MERFHHVLEKYSQDFLGVSATIFDVRNMPRHTTGIVKHRPLETDRVTFIIGELLGHEKGTRVGPEGNSADVDFEMFKPGSGKCVQDVFVLGRPSNHSHGLDDVWDKQLEMLKLYKDYDDVHDNALSWFPSIIQPWDTGPRGDVITVLWDKYQPVDRTRTEVLSTRERVEEGSFYEPAVLGHHDRQYLNDVDDALVQHPILDDQWKIVPPWRLSTEYLPGSLLLVLASLYCKDIDVVDGKRPEEFIRRYEIRGQSAAILERGPAQTDVEGEDGVTL